MDYDVFLKVSFQRVKNYNFFINVFNIFSSNHLNYYVQKDQKMKGCELIEITVRKRGLKF